MGPGQFLRTRGAPNTNTTTMGRTDVERRVRAVPIVPWAVPDLAGTTRSAERGTGNAPPTVWWLWPHLLSLDAPLVALVWQDWWSRMGRTPLPISQRAILGLGVWMIYLADRLADTARGRPDEAATARHAFAGARRLPLLVLTALVGAGLVLLAPSTLRVGQFCAGLVLLTAAAGYFWMIHRRSSQSWMARVPKEAAVGGMFALGTAFFPLCRPSPPPGPLLLAVVFFGATCFLNCALITSWERNLCDQRDPFSFLNAFPWLASHGLRPMCWLLAGMAGGAGLATHGVVFLPVVLAALALGMLDRCHRRIAPDALRFLADAMLLTPWICESIFAAIRS